MSCKLSIIVPVYKVESYLNRCIDSILQQTFTDFELILVDDGSPDNCGKICDDYSKIDHRIKIIHKENGGLSSARNAGISIASGEYITFVDSDDFLHKNMYEILFHYATKHSSDIVICDYLEVYEDNLNTTEINNFHFKEENFSNLDGLNSLYSDKGVQFVVAWNKLFKKQLFDNIRFEENKIHEDEFIAHRLIFNSSKIIYLPIKLYYYVQRKNSITGLPFNIKKLDLVKAYKDRVNFFKQINQPELKDKTEYYYISMFFQYYFKAKKELPNCYQDLKILKREFCTNIFSYMKNPYFKKKEKIAFFLFAIHSPLFEYLTQSKTK